MKIIFKLIIWLNLNFFAYQDNILQYTTNKQNIIKIKGVKETERDESKIPAVTILRPSFVKLIEAIEFAL